QSRRRDLRARSVAGVDDAHPLEGAERLADAGAADAELDGQRALAREAPLRAEMVVADEALDLSDDVVDDGRLPHGLELRLHHAAPLVKWSYHFMKRLERGQGFNRRYLSETRKAIKSRSCSRERCWASPCGMIGGC